MNQEIIDEETAPAAASAIEERDQAVTTLRAELHRLVRESPKTQRDIERENGYARGYLSQVLNDHMSLTARHVLGILRSLEIPPGRFFSRLFPGSEDSVLAGPGAVESVFSRYATGDREPDGMLSEIRERMAVYDSAIRELREKGLLDRGEE